MHILCIYALPVTSVNAMSVTTNPNRPLLTGIAYIHNMCIVNVCIDKMCIVHMQSNICIDNICIVYMQCLSEVGEEGKVIRSKSLKRKVIR